MHRIAVVIGLLSLGAVLGAREPVRNPQVDAATADAVESLGEQVRAVHLTPDVTVDDLLSRIGGRDELEKTLRAAEELGGPRWLGEQVVQVRLSIDGGKVAKSLLKIAELHPDRSPIPLEALRRQLKTLSDRVFSATGTSAAASDAAHLRPNPANRAWAGVSDAERRQALVAARDNAVNRVLESLALIQMPEVPRLNGALKEPAVTGAVRDWILRQPVKSVEFEDDLTVHLTLSDAAEELFPMLRDALLHQSKVALSSTAMNWDKFREQLELKLVPATGIGVVQPPATQGAAAITLPAQAPSWVVQQAEAQATSPEHGSRLKTAREAEKLALDALRQQLQDLPIGKGVTVGAAAQSDPRIQRAIKRIVSRARPFQVDYLAKGAVTVHVSVSLADLWAEMTDQQ